MNCVVWNALGLGNQRAFRELRHLIAERRTSVIFISESKLVKHQCTFWKHILKCKGLFIVDCVGRRGGLVMMWFDLVDVSLRSYSPGHIDCVVSSDQWV